MKRIIAISLVLLVVFCSFGYAATYEVTTEKDRLIAHEPGTKKELDRLPKGTRVEGYEKNGQIYFYLPNGKLAFAWAGLMTEVDGDGSYYYGTPANNPNLPPSVGGGAHWGEGLTIGCQAEAKTTNKINVVVRKGPGFDYGENGHIKLGEIITVTAITDDGKWVQVKRAHQTSPCGWVWYQTLDPIQPAEEPEVSAEPEAEVPVDTNADNAEATAPAPTEGAQWGKGLVEGGTAKVKTSNGKNLLVRSGPGKDYGIVMNLAPGTTIKVISILGDWTYIGASTGEIYGYVWTGCLAPVNK